MCRRDKTHIPASHFMAPASSSDLQLSVFMHFPSEPVSYKTIKGNLHTMQEMRGAFTILNCSHSLVNPI